jgi:hypothetical protein
MKRDGPSTDPCGIPESTSHGIIILASNYNFPLSVEEGVMVFNATFNNIYVISWCFFGEGNQTIGRKKLAEGWSKY